MSKPFQYSLAVKLVVIWFKTLPPKGRLGIRNHLLKCLHSTKNKAVGFLKIGSMFVTVTLKCVNYRLLRDARSSSKDYSNFTHDKTIRFILTFNDYFRVNKSRN
jgi:hypothetical protein